MNDMIQWLKEVIQTICKKTEVQQLPMPMQQIPSTPQDPSPIPTYQPSAVEFLSVFCSALRDYEGWAAPGETLNGTTYPNGTMAYQCKNPGNIRCPANDPSIWNHLAIAGNDGFCVFPDYATGLQAQKNVILPVASGTALPTSAYALYAKKIGLVSTAYMTLLDYFTVRDPVADKNDPVAYAEFMGRALDVDYKTWQMKNLV